MGAGKGQASRVVRIWLDYYGDAAGLPRSLIGKFPSDSAGTLKLAHLFRLYEREVGFYSDLGGRAGPPVPQLYHAGFNTEDGSFVVLIEDVTGAASGDLASGCSLATAARVIEVIGEMHAAWWNSPDLAQLKWLPSPDYVLSIEYEDPVAQDPWGTFLARTRGELPQPIIDICRVMRRDGSVLRRLATGPLTLVHGDLRINNVMISQESGDVRVLLDWQTAVRGRGPMDLASLFTSSLQPDDRRVAEAELLPAYHAQLLHLGVTGYTLEDCYRDYRLAVANQFAQVVFLSSVLDMEDRLEEGVSDATALRLAAALIDLDVAGLLDCRPAWQKRLSRAVRSARRRLTRS